MLLFHFFPRLSLHALAVLYFAFLHSLSLLSLSCPSAGRGTMQQPAGTAAFASHNCPKCSHMPSLSHLEFSEISFLYFLFFGSSLRCSPFSVCFAFFCLFIWLSGECFSCVWKMGNGFSIALLGNPFTLGNILHQSKRESHKEFVPLSRAWEKKC